MQTCPYNQLSWLDIGKEVKDGGQQWSQNFDYDQYGNRCLRASNPTPCTPDINAAQNNRLAGYSYDGAGNQTNDDYHTYAYDAENHIKSVDGVAAYVYDGEGNRVRKLLGENLRMVYGIGGDMLAEFDGTSGALKKEYIYGANGLAATIAAGEGTRYVTADHLGSPRIITSTNGAVVSRHDYQPFGEELFVGMGDRISAQGYSNPVDSLRQKFTGYERDNETGLDFAQARYYGSMMGRFTSADPYNPIVDTEDAGEFNEYLGQPQNWNRYVYVWNNPLRYIDPFGEKVYVVTYTYGNSEGDADFKRAA